MLMMIIPLEANNTRVHVEITVTNFFTCIIWPYIINDFHTQGFGMWLVGYTYAHLL